MTEHELRALDGPALTAEAFRLWLAPEMAWSCPSASGIFLSVSCEWIPHINLAQADACLRRIRERDYSTTVHGAHHDAEGQAGYCTAWNPMTREGVHVYWALDAPRDPEVVATEAHALLLCAVLAVSQRGGAA